MLYKVQPFSEIWCLDCRRVIEFLFGFAFLFISKTLNRYRGQKDLLQSINLDDTVTNYFVRK